MGTARAEDVPEALAESLAALIHAGSAEQQARCSIRLAEALAVAADRDPARRLEAFDACERAIERIMGLAPPLQATLAASLLAAIGSRDYLQLCVQPLRLAIPGESAHPDLQSWQPRLSAEPVWAWMHGLKAYYQANPLWFQIEDQRASLAPAASAEPRVAADWTHWTVEHPAYRTAVPQHRSFLREGDLDAKLMVLTHELTHVLSFLSGIGVALSCLRAAAHYDEWVLLQSVADRPATGPQAPAAGVLRAGVAPLGAHLASGLVRSEHALELALKARALQDAWTPWLEGLAVFGETAADPLQDSEIIDPVNNALRNLIDLQAPLEAPADQPAVDELAGLIEEYQQRASEALRASGPRRLKRYLRYQQDGRDQALPYRAGYLALRAVVSRWRRTAGRAISAAEAFRLLLHATRYDSHSAIPDLSLPAAEFAAAAADSMARWVARLARLTRRELDLLASLDGTRVPAVDLRWVSGRPRLVGRAAGAADEALAVARDLLAQALAGLSAPSDVDRVSGADKDLGFYLEYAAWVLREKQAGAGFHDTFESLLRLAGQLMRVGSFLPIARCHARFFLNHPPGRDQACLVTLLRTTEQHVEGGSSMNLLAAGLEERSAQLLAAQIAREASPRLEVTRVIDLGGELTREIGQSGVHLLAYRLGDWFELRGCSDGVQQWMDARPQLKESLVELVRIRLYPNPHQAAEADLAASAEAAASRTRDWIGRAAQWMAGGEPIAAEPWAAHVHELAGQVLDAGRRERQQAAAATALLSAVFGDSALAGELVAQDFQTLTAAVPQERERIVEALFDSALGTGQDASAAQAARALRRCPGKLLRRYAHGWDVRSASPLAAGRR